MSLFEFFYFFYFFLFFSNFFFRKSPLFIFFGSRYLYNFDFCNFFIFVGRDWMEKNEKGGGRGGSGGVKMKKVEKIEKSGFFVGAKLR